MIPAPTQAAVQPKQRLQSLLKVCLGTLFFMLLAQVRIPLPWTPIPFTFQTLAVMLLAVTLGRKSALCVALYLMQVCFGLPVMAGWHVDAYALFGLKGGYFIGMVFQAYLLGYYCDMRVKKSLVLNTVVFVGADMIMLLLGTAQLSFFVPIGQALALGFYPFILIEMVKIFFCLCYYRNILTKV